MAVGECINVGVFVRVSIWWPLSGTISQSHTTYYPTSM